MSEKPKKSIIFLENGFILNDKEEELIEKCSENEIIVLTYSRIDDKKVDVEHVRKKSGKRTEYEKINETTSIVGLVDEWNDKYDLHIDVTFATPYHAMELTPFGYLKNNRVTVLINGELKSTGQRYIDYSKFKDTELEVMEELMCGKHYTVNEIGEIWNKQNRKAKKTIKREGFDGKPDFTKTLHRIVNKLTDNGYICKEEGHPAKYYVDCNQKFMYRLTRNCKKSEPSNPE